MAAPKKNTKFKPGDPKPPNSGRRKGTPNKLTSKLRELWTKVAENFSEKEIVEDLKKMSPKDRVSALMGMSEYAIPKLSRVEMETDPGTVMIEFSPEVEALLKPVAQRPKRKPRAKSKSKNATRSPSRPNRGSKKP